MGKALRRFSVGLAGVLACCVCSFALDPSLDISQYAHTAWKVREGFSKGSIFSIAQTQDGYLWLGTEFGVLRFDGVRAVQWQPPGGQHLPSNGISTLVAGHDGTLWIGTLKGLASWRDGKLTQYPLLAGRTISALIEDREGTIWLGSYFGPPGRLCSIHGGSVQCYGDDRTFGQWILSLYEDRAGNLWAGTESGLWRWKPGPKKFYPVSGSSDGFSGIVDGDNGGLLISLRAGIGEFVDGKVRASALPLAGREFRPRSLLRDRDGCLWIGTSNRGLLHVHQGKTDSFRQAHGLSSNFIFGLFEDREGNIWVATPDGLDCFRDFAISTLSVNEGLSNASVSATVVARDGSVWIATTEGLDRWKDGQIRIYRKQDGLPDDSTQAMFQDDRGRIWVATRRGIAYFENGRFIPVSRVPKDAQAYSFAGDRDGNIWIAEDEGLLHLFAENVVEKFSWANLQHKDDLALSITMDPLQGGLWLGFWQGGVAHFKDGRVLAIYGKADGLGEGRVNQLQFDSDGTLWAATEGGLSKVKNGHIDTLSSRNGLPCDTVHWMMQDDAHSLWLYMPCGLARIPQSELSSWVADPNRRIQATVFDSRDGVGNRATPTSYSPRVARAADGKLLFAEEDGEGIIDPLHLAFNKLPPPIHIEQLTADGKAYDASNNLRLRPHVRDLEIDYTALSLVAPEKMHFRYKLEGLDSDWQDVGIRRQAFYTNLPPRNYRFRVIASNNSGVWNERGASLDFAIAPAYYQTNWFLALCGLSFLAMLWSVYHLRVRVLERRHGILEKHQIEIRALNEQLITAQEAERMRISGELHDGVLQQITSLTLRLGKVRRQVPPDSEATVTVAGLQQDLIKVGTDIRHISHELHPALLQEAGLPAALSAYCEEFSKVRGLPVSCEADESVGELSPGAALCLYRIAQEALGNAAKYSGSKKVRVRLIRANGSVCLSVSDDGVGCTPDELRRSGGLGVINMRERVLQLRGTFEFDSAPGCGTTVKAEVPFRPAL